MKLIIVRHGDPDYSIDVARAEASKVRAESVIEKDTSSDTEIELATARLHRALVRKNVASYKY